MSYFQKFVSPIPQNVIERPTQRIVFRTFPTTIRKGQHKGGLKIPVYMGVLRDQPLADYEKAAYLAQGQRVGLHLRKELEIKFTEQGRDWYWMFTSFEQIDPVEMKAFADEQRAIIAAARLPQPKVQAVMSFEGAKWFGAAAEVPAKKEVMGSMTF